ncbi:MAG: ABC transporter substrate-binding protein [Oscillibacter sp.]|nr:ABC transporter substrate-binding protein [Oscillibacter sp.]
MAARKRRAFPSVPNVLSFLTVLSFLSLSCLLASCSTGAPARSIAEAGETPVEMADMLSITDDLGRTVTVPQKPERVAVLLGSFTDVWVLAGGLDTLAAAADDAWTSFDLPLGENVRNLGGVFHLNLEELLAAEPDLILASCDTTVDTELLPTFEKLGIPALYFEVQSFADYLRMLDICTQITGHRENYAQYGEAVGEQVDAALAMEDGTAPSVLCLRAGGTSVRAKGSEGTVLGEMLSALGCRNIADGNHSILEDLSLEAILAEDPDFIFLVYQGSSQKDAEKAVRETLESNPAWGTLRAVREGRVYVMDRGLYHFKPNARWGDAYEQLARILYGWTDTGETV